MKLTGKIFWGKQSRWQLIVATAGFWIGLFITLLSIQFYLDVKQIVKRGEDEKSYLIINKTVNMINMFDKSISMFTETELDSLQSQPFVKDIGLFRTNTFNIYADVSDQMGLAFDLYMESVPDRFLDTLPASFEWDSTDSYIPILIASDFLRIYNFSLAMSQKSMPQLSPATIKLIPISIKIAGNERSKQVTAKVVGFTDRIPSVLVPENFLLWANATYGSGPSPQPTRVIVEVDDPANATLKQYLTDKGYDTNQDQLRLGSMANTLKIISGISGTVGGLFVFLSFAIFLMNFQLIISRAKTEIGILLDLGYRPMELAYTLNKQFFIVLWGCAATVLVVEVVIVAAVHANLRDYGFDVTTSISWVIPAAALVLLAMLQGLLYLSIKSGIRR
ncbi:hypothetical protein BH09BAC1_BH09BAC1_24490 [soil metagenome]